MHVQELNITDAAVFEREAQRRIDQGCDALSAFIIDMSGVSKIFSRSGREANVAFLSAIARLLARVCREGDTVCRIGDSTFGVLFADMDSRVFQQLAAEKIVRLYDSALREMNAAYQSSVCIGVSSYPEHAGNAERLIRNANLALEAAEAKGEPYLIYSAQTVETMTMKWNLQDDLAEAITSQALEIFYQPQIEVATGKVTGCEALLRWRNGEYGEVPPSVFVPLACELGLIDELTKMALTTALQNASEWPNVGRKLAVSINLEPQTLMVADIDKSIADSLSIWGTDKVALTLEITESALVSDSKSNFESLNRLREIGVGISIDDFGTGYSSLSYFTNIPATELKIDPSFISTMCESKRARHLVETIIGLADRFDLKVVAEGVETDEQLALLKQMKCDIAQGYRIAKPLSHQSFCRWLAER